MQDECTMPACAAPVKHVGLCSTHYSRRMDHGDPAWEPPPPPTMEQRFWAKVEPGNAEDCWEWQGATNGRYGRFWFDRRPISAHRFSWELHNGRALADGMYVCHRCDNPPCVNPAHLFEGTPRENQQDMWQKGRSRCTTGSARRSTKLLESQVDAIRHLLVEGALSDKEIGERYGVSRAAVGEIANGRSWRFHETSGVSTEQIRARRGARSNIGKAA